MHIIYAFIQKTQVYKYRLEKFKLNTSLFKKNCFIPFQNFQRLKYKLVNTFTIYI